MDVKTPDTVHSRPASGKWTQQVPTGWFYIAPVVLYLLIVTIFPTIYVLYNSLFDFNLVQPQLGHHFVGVHNYVQMATDPDFISSLLVTLKYVVPSVLLEALLGLGLALLMDSRAHNRIVRVLRSIFLIPIMVAPIIVGYLWYLILNRQTGVASYYLSQLGLLHGQTTILGSPHLALPALVFVDVWEWTPFAALILLAGLQNMPNEPLEAAQVDGASRFDLFRYVKLPLLQQSLLVVILFRLIDALRLFDVPFILTGGGPGSSTETWGLYVYEQGFQRYNMGYAMALGLVLLITCVIVGTLIFNKMWER